MARVSGTSVNNVHTKECLHIRLAADEVFSQSDLQCYQREWWLTIICMAAVAGARSTESGPVGSRSSFPSRKFCELRNPTLVWTQVFMRVCQMAANGVHKQCLHCGELTVCQVPCHVLCGAKHASYFCDYFLLLWSVRKPRPSEIK